MPPESEFAGQRLGSISIPTLLDRGVKAITVVQIGYLD